MLNKPCVADEGGGAPFLPADRSLPVHPGDQTQGNEWPLITVISPHFFLNLLSVLGINSNETMDRTYFKPSSPMRLSSRPKVTQLAN